jgi:hypothetical protein
MDAPASGQKPLFIARVKKPNCVVVGRMPASPPTLRFQKVKPIPLAVLNGQRKKAL